MTYQRGEIDMLLRKVGHNLHDPLSMIIHLADMIGIDTEEQTSEETKNYAKRIRTSANDLLDCVDKLLELVSVESIPYPCAPLDVNLPIRMAIERSQTIGHIVSTTLEKLPLVYGNVKKIQRVIQLLIHNMLRISAQEVVVTASVSDGFVIVSVQENCEPSTFGQKMRLEQLVQSRSDGELAVDLLLIQRIIGQHGGQVWAMPHAEQDRVSFHISLPISMDLAVVEAENNISAEK